MKKLIVTHEKDCTCVCHENVLKRPHEHDTQCCEDMNGYLTTQWQCPKCNVLCTRFEMCKECREEMSNKFK